MTIVEAIRTVLGVMERRPESRPGPADQDGRALTMPPLPPPVPPSQGAAPTGRRFPPLWVVLGLAALGVPRVVMHDLDLGATPIYLVLTLGPPLVWLAYLVRSRPARMTMSGVLIGGVYGVLLAATHQLLWTEAFDEPPKLGGNLEGRLEPWLEDVVLRGASVLSSVGTGAAIGLVVGLLAVAVSDRRDPSRRR